MVDESAGSSLRGFLRIHRLGLLTIGLIAGTFLFDLYTPLGKTVWVFYFPAIVVALYWKGRRSLLAVTASVIVLAILGFWLSPPGMRDVAAFNRGIFILSAVGLAGFFWWLFTERERHLAGIIESAPNGMLLVNQDGTIALVNAKVERWFGYHRQELLGQPIEVLIPERFRQDHVGQRAGFFRSPAHRDMGEGRDLYGRRKDGTEFPLEIGLTPIPVLAGTQVLASIVDITQRKEIENREAARINRLKKLSAWSLTHSDDPNHIFEQAIRVLGEIFSVPVVCLSEIVGEELYFKAVLLNGQIFLDAGRCPLTVTPCATVETTKDLRVYDRVMERFPMAPFLRDHRAVAYCGAPSLDSRGEVVAVICLMDDKPRDFTEEDQELLRVFSQRIATEIERAQSLAARNEAEAALRQSEERLRLVIQGTNEGIWDWNITTHENYTSSRWKEILGYRQGEIPDTETIFFDLIHPDDRAAVHEALRRHLEEHEPYGVEIRMRHRNGRYLWCLTRGEAVRDVQGHPVRMVGSLTDITARKQAEERLRRSEAFVSSVVDNLPIMVFVKDASDLRFVRLNKAGEALLGYSHRELLGKNDYDFFPEHEADCFTAADQKVLAGGRLLDIPEEPIQTKENGIRYLHTKKIPICDVDGVPQFLLGISEDITERKQMEEALRESHAELERRVLERTEELASAIDTLQAEVIEHKRTEEALKKREDDLHTAQAQAHLGSWSWDLRTATNTWSDENYRIFGFTPQSVEPCYEVFAGSLHGEDRERVLDAVRAAVEEDAPYDVECRIVRPSGEIRHVHCRGNVTRDDKGESLRMAGTVLDITERKRLEEELVQHNEELELRMAERAARVRELELQRAQTEKLAALGQLAAGVAHEINNPIAGIKNAFLVVKPAIPEQFAQYHFVGLIDREIDRVSNIVKQMYQLYRAEPRRHQPVDLTIVTHDLAALVANRLAQRHLTLTVEIGASIPMLHLPQGDLLQVLLNLINNAIDSSPEQAAIILRVRDEPHAVCVSVTDQGSGIPPELLPRIFEPFFTTKTAGPSAGMGLGLSVSHSLVQAMGGRIDVQSQLNEGTTVTVLLPLSADSIEPSGSSHQLQEGSIHDR